MKLLIDPIAKDFEDMKLLIDPIAKDFFT